jgi:hypothetical protein
MSPNEIVEVLDARPFEPFRLVVSSGNVYDIDAPHQVVVANRYVHIAMPAHPGDRIAERIIRIDLLHVTELVPLRPPQQQSQGNGQSPG